MREFPTIRAFIDFLITRIEPIHHAQIEGARAAGELLVHEAQQLIGTEDREWAPLAESTVIIKEERGWVDRVSPTDPLLRTGQMRGSIEFTASEHEVVLGTHDPVAEEQENGTEHMPARPFISTTMMRHGHEAAELAYDHVMAAFCDHPPPKGPHTSVD